MEIQQLQRSLAGVADVPSIVGGQQPSAAGLSQVSASVIGNGTIMGGRNNQA